MAEQQTLARQAAPASSVGPPPLIALVGNPNAGKTALFNALTGARQKVGNYPGVTVERHAGRWALTDGRPVELVDLPGAYSLDPSSPDEAVTRDVVTGRAGFERLPDVLIVVVDAGNLEHHLRFTLQLIALGRRVVVALNMVDLAERDGLTLDADALSKALGVPVIATVAVRKRGVDQLREAVGTALDGAAPVPGEVAEGRALGLDARRLARTAIVAESPVRRWTHAFDRVALHPIWGTALLLTVLFTMFQAVFSWAQAPADLIDGTVAAVQGWLAATLPPGFVRDLLVQGVLAGVGAVVVFLPQILILFAFILVLEASGYMVRAAFLMDRLMASVGLSGRAFIPLLSSFACAVPGIMATRTIEDEKDRLTTILIAPLMTCSARWPVYTLIIGALIPARRVAPGVGLQGLIMFALLLIGVAGAYAAALILRRTVTKGASSGFMLEMPKYQMPRLRDIGIGLWTRALIFLKRAGTTIALTVALLWVLSSYPVAPAGQRQSEYSIAGRIASVIEVAVRPIGFNHDIALALLPAMAAREAAVAAIGTVYAVDNPESIGGGETMTRNLRERWTLPTALAFLMWFVFAPQCISTIAVTRRETNGWRWPLFMVGYLFAAAYVMAGATYWLAVLAGL